VSTDTWADNRAFASAHGLEFPLLSDWPARATAQAFGVLDEGGTARRVTFILDSAGVIRGVIENIEAGAHAAAALALLRELDLEVDGRV
jgi:thioredoxin-dependent peroxiredoxin